MVFWGNFHSIFTLSGQNCDSKKYYLKFIIIYLYMPQICEVAKKFKILSFGNIFTGNMAMPLLDSYHRFLPSFLLFLLFIRNNHKNSIFVQSKM